MKLYFAPGACSLAAHIVAREAGLPINLEKVDLGSHRTEAGVDYFTINPKGYVPALSLDDGSILTEVAALVQFLADQRPEKNLAPAAGTMERYRLQEWIAFIGSEIHKGFGPLWNPETPEAAKAAAKEKLARRFAYLDTKLATQPFLMGSAFTIADAYLFTVVNWVNFLGIDITPFGHLKAFLDRVGSRPNVQEALLAEGLLKQAA